MELIVHRGVDQIGGCVVEIKTARTRIFIDFGTELPGADGETKEETLEISGLTKAARASERTCDGVLFTHAHSDHMGNIHRILPSVPLYMGTASREIALVLNQELQSKHESYPERVPDQSKTRAALKRAETFTPGKAFPIGDFKIMPIRVDHSAFDAYMFRIEGEGKTMLHTGDFRDHGYTGGALKRTLTAYAGKVDWLITEGTMLSRPGKGVLTEAQLEAKAKERIGSHKHIFVLCSSTNIDRIRAFYNARPAGSPLVCDAYQYEILEQAEANPPPADPAGYCFDYKRIYSKKKPTLLRLMEEKGFVMPIRPKWWFKRFLEQYKDDSVIFYSMWEGYLEGPAKSQRIIDFLAGYDYEPLHTSGHATIEALREVYETVRPRHVVPIHSEKPERFSDLLPPDADIVFLENGKAKTL